MYPLIFSSDIDEKALNIYIIKNFIYFTLKIYIKIKTDFFIIYFYFRKYSYE